MTLIPASGAFPSDEFSRVVLEATGLMTQLAAIGVRVSSPPQEAESGTVCAVKILEFTWEAPRWRELTVELSSAATGGADKYCAPNTLARISDARPQLVSLDVSTDEYALAAARWLIAQNIQRFSLAQFSTLQYTGPIDYGDTLYVRNYDFTGVVYAYHKSLTGGFYRADFTLLNLAGGED